jgi:hypothetical protein
MGLHFNRELDFPFSPYCKEYLSSSDCAHLFAVNPDIDRYYACGACLFQWIEWQNAPPSFLLGWVWFHPYFRHRGLLSSVWPYFQEKYGDFFVQEPLSPAMRSFLDKQGYVRPIPNRPDSCSL